MTKHIESIGIDTVPDNQRTGKPRNIISVFVGSNLSLSVMVFGWLGILYGLSWWQSVSAILVGTFVAAAFVSASSLLGWRAATNNSVSSGAFFGVKGRLIASFVDCTDLNLVFSWLYIPIKPPLAPRGVI